VVPKGGTLTGDDEKGRAAVTRYGSWRGKRFVGCGRQRERTSTLTVLDIVLRSRRGPKGQPRSRGELVAKRDPTGSGGDAEARTRSHCDEGAVHSALEQGERRSGNLANPMVGCRVQQTCRAPAGANRRSHEKWQGWNESEAWLPLAKGLRVIAACGDRPKP